ncbi:MAG: hypothetical protein EOO79_05435, partial [Oxalobacteraceae bacterium]
MGVATLFAQAATSQQHSLLLLYRNKLIYNAPSFPSRTTLHRSRPTLPFLYIQRFLNMKFNRLKIGNRLGLGFALILVFLIASTVIGILRLQALADATHAMMEQPLAKERMISDWYRYVYAGIRRTTAIVKIADPSLGPFFADDAANTVKQSQDLKKRIDDMVSSDEERALFGKLADVSKRYLSTRADITKAKDAGNQEEASRQFEQGYLPASLALVMSARVD